LKTGVLHKPELREENPNTLKKPIQAIADENDNISPDKEVKRRSKRIKKPTRAIDFNKQEFQAKNTLALKKRTRTSSKSSYHKSSKEEFERKLKRSKKSVQRKGDTKAHKTPTARTNP